MGYYLSKQNRQILSVFTPRLKSETGDYTLDLINPDRLVYIIRQATSIDEFTWIKDKWIISSGNKTITFKLKQPELLAPSDSLLSLNPDSNINQDTLDFYGLVNDLLINPPLNCLYTNVFLNPTEVALIKAWCEQNDYSLILNEDSSIKIIQNQI